MCLHLWLLKKPSVQKSWQWILSLRRYFGSRHFVQKLPPILHCSQKAIDVLIQKFSVFPHSPRIKFKSIIDNNPPDILSHTKDGHCLNSKALRISGIHYYPNCIHCSVLSYWLHTHSALSACKILSHKYRCSNAHSET